MARRSLEKIVSGLNEKPQGWNKLGIKGRRSVDDRMRLYDLPLNKDMNVLDIGCNIGLLTLAISEQVKSILGIDTNPAYINIANQIKNEIENSNSMFMHANYVRTHFKSHSFDMILSLQIHYWIKIDLIEYILKIRSELKEKGYLVFESNNINTVDKNIDDKIDVIMKCGFSVIKEVDYIEENPPSNYSEPPGELKPMNRRFVLFQLKS